ncbi:hypothetical protein HAX54_034467 [Datura stramonium]|uniref:Protein kinase domain-containing protein n=1 Tax=Datura stramonium TaxID=4076 RepID=A0ABS8SEL3_DATST|nr:hypothetical protein [Datura stramonium]
MTHEHQNPSTIKQRALSPLSKTKLSDTFKEARSSQRRFSTPHPQGKGHKKGIVDKLFLKDSHEMKTSVVSRLVTAVETTEEYTVDLSKLFLGLRFSHGAHIQLYHGIYKDEPVAMKMIKLHDDDESGDLAARLDNQFSREVTLLSQRHHQNVVKFVGARRKTPVFCVVTKYLSDGLYRWMAPEMIKRKSYGWKVDVYGFGLVLWEMVAGTIPYEDMALKQATFAIVSKVLEQFESSVAHDGTLNLVQNSMFRHKKGFLHQSLSLCHEFLDYLALIASPSPAVISELLNSDGISELVLAFLIFYFNDAIAIRHLQHTSD